MTGLNRAFWEGRRVFLTGHTGFKGGWLTCLLHALGAKVSGFSLAPDGDRSFFSDASVEALCTHSTIGDIRDSSALRDAMAAANPQIVLHLAAQALVRKSYADPIGTFSTNVVGTVNVLDACRSAPELKAIVSVTTDKVYENKEWEWGYREIDPLGGFDPYSASKACADLATTAYFKSFLREAGIGVATCRAGNVIGGGDWSEDRLVPDAMLAFEAGTLAKIRNPLATRPWQHVLDPIAGYLRCAEALVDDATQFSGAYNFGPAESGTRNVADVATRLAAAWGDAAGWEHENPEANPPHEARALALDVAKARYALGWEGRFDLDTAVKWTVEWYRKRAAAANMRDVSAGQVRAYLERVWAQ